MDERFVKGGPLPNSVGAQADLYAVVRDLRLQMQKAVDEVKERETEIYNVIMSTLKESADSGAAGQNYRVQLVTKQRQNVKDWPAFHAFVRQYDLFEMLQKRLADKAVEEFTEKYQQLPPGVESVDVPTLSFNKV